MQNPYQNGWSEPMPPSNSEYHDDEQSAAASAYPYYSAQQPENSYSQQPMYSYPPPPPYPPPHWPPPVDGYPGGAPAAPYPYPPAAMYAPPIEPGEPYTAGYPPGPLYYPMYHHPQSVYPSEDPSGYPYPVPPPVVPAASPMSQSKPLPVPRPPKRSKRPARNKPKRPLSAYNLFFKDMRAELLQKLPSTLEGPVAKPRGKRPIPHGKIGFAALAKAIAAKWKEVEPETLKGYQERADADMIRYKKELEEYMEASKKGPDDEE